MDPRASVKRCASPLLLANGMRVDCGRCDSCCFTEAREFMARSNREFDCMGEGKLAVMGTLTFTQEALPQAMHDWGHAFWTTFRERLEHEVPGLKLFGVPEFGKRTGRLHLHFTAYRVPAELCRVWHELVSGKPVAQFEFRQVVRQAWPHGTEKGAICWSPGGARYVMKYVGKGRLDRKRDLDDWRARLRAAKAKGLSGLFLPAKPKRLYWVGWPRGRLGGLGRQFAEYIAEVCRNAPSVVAGIDLPPHLIGAGGRRVHLSRYERRVARRVLGLDSPEAKARREAINPERVEMAARIAAAGSVRALRRAGGHVDEDVAALAQARAQKARELGRW